MPGSREQRAIQLHPLHFGLYSQPPLLICELLLVSCACSVSYLCLVLLSSLGSFLNAVLALCLFVVSSLGSLQYLLHKNLQALPRSATYLINLAALFYYFNIYITDVLSFAPAKRGWGMLAYAPR